MIIWSSYVCFSGGRYLSTLIQIIYLNAILKKLFFVSEFLYLCHFLTLVSCYFAYILQTKYMIRYYNMMHCYKLNFQQYTTLYTVGHLITIITIPISLPAPSSLQSLSDKVLSPCQKRRQSDQLKSDLPVLHTVIVSMMCQNDGSTSRSQDEHKPPKMAFLTVMTCFDVGWTCSFFSSSPFFLIFIFFILASLHPMTSIFAYWHLNEKTGTNNTPTLIYVHLLSPSFSLLQIRWL